MGFGIIYSKRLNEYDFGQGHPFRGDRFDLFRPFLLDNLAGNTEYTILEAEPASDDDLLLICSREYIDFTTTYYGAASAGLDYPAQYLWYQSRDNMPGEKPGKLEEAARLIIGQAKAACDLVTGNKYNKIISIGGGLHHAKPDYGEGFCLYNDVAFCGKYLINKNNYERILILDTDAHAGNGTSEYFYDDPRVLFIDMHQNPINLYPGVGYSDEVGSGNGQGFTINIPLPMYAGYDSYELVFESIVEPVVREFKPQIIIRNGGSDPHFNDGLTALGLSLRGFRMIGEKVRNMAEICDGKVIDLIASGYNIDVLPDGWMALIAGLTGIEFDISEPEPVIPETADYSPLARTEKVIEEVRRYHKDYWNCFR